MSGELSPEFEPCPFCGSSKVGSFFTRDGRRIACLCGASVISHQPDAEAKARAAWNTRSEPSPIATEAEDLREAFGGIFDIEPDLGAPTSEPSIRHITYYYYRQASASERAAELADQYIKALSAALSRPQTAAWRPDREAAARIIYETWETMPEYVPWVEGGNSLKQDDARRAADRLLALSDKDSSQ